MQTFLVILSSFFFGYACSRIAIRKRRHPTHWFIMGVLFGFLALILIALLPPPPLKFFHRKQEIIIKKIPSLVAIEPKHMHKIWYYLNQEQVQFGPMSLDALSRDWREGKVKSTSFVWNEELDDWKALQEVLRPE